MTTERVKRAGPAVSQRGAASQRSCATPQDVAGRRRATGSPEVLEVVMLRLRVIGEPTRVQIMELLDQHGSATVQEITDRLPGASTRQNVSKHLGMLHAAGLLGRHRDGVFTRYELADWTALWLIEQVAISVQEQLETQRVTLARDAPVRK